MTSAPRTLKKLIVRRELKLAGIGLDGSGGKCRDLFRRVKRNKLCAMLPFVYFRVVLTNLIFWFESEIDANQRHTGGRWKDDWQERTQRSHPRLARNRVNRPTPLREKNKNKKTDKEFNRSCWMRMRLFFLQKNNMFLCKNDFAVLY